MDSNEFYTSSAYPATTKKLWMKKSSISAQSVKPENIYELSFLYQKSLSPYFELVIATCCLAMNTYLLIQDTEIPWVASILLTAYSFVHWPVCARALTPTGYTLFSLTFLILILACSSLSFWRCLQMLPLWFSNIYTCIGNWQSLHHILQCKQDLHSLICDRCLS